MSESELDDALDGVDVSDPEEGGGEDVQIDPDLEAALADSGEGDAPAEGGAEDVQLDPDLEAALADSGEGDAPAEGGGDMDFGDDLEAALASVDVDDADAGGGEVSGGDMSGMDALADALGEGGAEAPAPSIGGLPSGALTGIDEETPNVEFLLEIKLHVTFEVGRAKMLISDLLTLGQGSVVELHRLVGDELDLLVNGKLLARGEVVVVNEKFGCRVSSVVPPEDRIKYLGSI
jgi:flagellar motor switch protein FliN/FliY